MYYKYNILHIIISSVPTKSAGATIIETFVPAIIVGPVIPTTIVLTHLDQNLKMVKKLKDRVKYEGSHKAPNFSNFPPFNVAPPPSQLWCKLFPALLCGTRDRPTMECSSARREELAQKITSRLWYEILITKLG